ncbi:hypothetical protein [Stenotrophomonas muris]|uniref:hypothetical protein n=1 Tax=Stenotrophomonas muris TaxID=2963283 RepID=UPI004042AC89
MNEVEAIPDGCISRRDAVIAALIAGVFGAGMALFAAGVLLLVFKETGNIADWTAAIGTWVIGYGAWKYARNAHRQRMQEYRESEIRRLRDNLLRVYAVMDPTAAILSVAIGIRDIEVGSDDRGVSDASTKCRTGIRVANKVEWRPEDLTQLSEEGFNSFGSLRMALYQLHSILERAPKVLDGKASINTKAEVVVLMKEVGRDVAIDATELLMHARNTVMQIRAEKLRIERQVP